MPLVSAADGKWLVPEGLAPILKPGGHGAIWKLMLDEGVFSWMYQHDREAAIVRQIRYAHCYCNGSVLEDFVHASPFSCCVCTLCEDGSAVTVHMGPQHVGLQCCYALMNSFCTLCACTVIHMHR